jgi:hypothetical protein
LAEYFFWEAGTCFNANIETERKCAAPQRSTIMTTQRLEQTVVGGRRMVGGWIVGFALVALLVAGWMTTPAPAQQAAASQPVVGRAITVTGLVFDGTRYVNMPISVGAPRAGQGYAVTALVYDGTTYRSAPVQVGGH